MLVCITHNVSFALTNVAFMGFFTLFFFLCFEYRNKFHKILAVILITLGLFANYVFVYRTFF